jgi:muramoyltetrapeptide carboxypeptidase
MDDEVAAVVAGRGGYGTQRMLDLLDWRRLAEARPKILAGFSDITALHLAVSHRLGLVSLHSHVTTSLGSASEDSAERMRAMLFEPTALDLFAESEVRPVVPGSATGVLIGGNLSMLAGEVGTAFNRPAVGGVVLLEDVSEEPYRLDRLLTQLLRTGWFDGVRGIVLGAFTDCGDPARVDAVLLDRLVPLGVPLAAGFDFGHTSTSRSVPLGVRATLAVPSHGAPTLVLAHPPFT